MSHVQDGERSGRVLSRYIASVAGAALASLALLATASSASAEPVGLFVGGVKSEEVAKQPKFEAEKYAATVKSTSLSTFEFVTQEGSLKCSSLAFPGTLSAASSEFKSEQFFSGCSLFGFATTTIQANGCYFKLHTLNAGPPYVGSADLVCSAGQGLKFTAFAFGTPVCTLKLLPKAGAEGISFENTGSGSSRAITAKFNLSAMPYALEGAIAPCKESEHTDGVFTVSDSLSATK